MRGHAALAGLAAAVLAAGVSVVAGPGSGSAVAEPSATAGAPAAPPGPAVLAGSAVLAPELQAPDPTRLGVPAIGIAADLVPLGLEPDGALQAPPDPSVAGWYTGAPAPGERGPAVLAGHVDSRRGPGVFSALEALRPGDAVLVTRRDGSVLRFVVDRVEQHPKAAFPTQSVYGPAPGPELRLITCGGSFERSEGHYRDNVVVFARLTEVAAR